MKHRIRYGLFALLLCLSSFSAVIGVNHYVFKEGLNPEVRASLGLLILNFGFFLGFSLTGTSVAKRLGPSFGLLLVTLKLFVNTFTIFLLIGLQAVRTHVFVPQLMTGYYVLLSGGILFLVWNSKRS